MKKLFATTLLVLIMVLCFSTQAQAISTPHITTSTDNTLSIPGSNTQTSNAPTLNIPGSNTPTNNTPSLSLPTITITENAGQENCYLALELFSKITSWKNLIDTIAPLTSGTVTIQNGEDLYCIMLINALNQISNASATSSTAQVDVCLSGINLSAVNSEQLLKKFQAIVDIYNKSNTLQLTLEAKATDNNCMQVNVKSAVSNNNNNGNNNATNIPTFKVEFPTISNYNSASWGTSWSNSFSYSSSSSSSGSFTTGNSSDFEKFLEEYTKAYSEFTKRAGQLSSFSGMNMSFT